jgi:hypothetical protein
MSRTLIPHPQVWTFLYNKNATRARIPATSVPSVVPHYATTAIPMACRDEKLRVRRVERGQMLAKSNWGSQKGARLVISSSSGSLEPPSPSAAKENQCAGIFRKTFSVGLLGAKNETPADIHVFHVPPHEIQVVSTRRRNPRLARIPPANRSCRSNRLPGQKHHRTTARRIYR